MDCRCQRVEWIDVARGIGICLIVLGHVLPNCDIRKFLYGFHVPLFFFLSGATFRPGSSFAVFLKKKCKSLLIPYWIVMFISILLFAWFGEYAVNTLNIQVNTFSWHGYLLGAVYGNGKTGWLKANLPLWFLPCLFLVEVFLYWLDRGLFSRKGNAGYWSGLAASTALFLVNNVAFCIGGLPFGMETAVNAMPFAIAGYGIKNGIISLPKIKRAASLLLAAAFATVCYLLSCFCNMQVYVVADSYGHLPVYLAAACCGIVSVYLISGANSPPPPVLQKQFHISDKIA